jgi:Spy/CpxP family protein refolding chaperone
MTIHIGAIAGALVVMTSLPITAQERAAPPPPPHERIERLRLDRLQESLGLTDEQTETLRRQMERSHEAMRGSFERQKDAMEALERSLAARPPDEDTLRRALAEVETAREAMEREREQHVAELSRTLTLEQRAKFLLFNRQFDSRLRELVERHRGGHAAPEGPGRDGERRAPSREERIDSLERRIAEMQEELEELRADDDD